MANVQIYGKGWCPYCIRAKEVLQRNDVSYEDIDIDNNPQLEAQMIARAERTSVPQVFINDVHVGGCDDLHDAEASGLLAQLLSESESEIQAGDSHE